MTIKTISGYRLSVLETIIHVDLQPCFVSTNVQHFIFVHKLHFLGKCMMKRQRQTTKAEEPRIISSIHAPIYMTHSTHHIAGSRLFVVYYSSLQCIIFLPLSSFLHFDNEARMSTSMITMAFKVVGYVKKYKNYNEMKAFIV